VTQQPIAFLPWPGRMRFIHCAGILWLIAASFPHTVQVDLKFIHPGLENQPTTAGPINGGTRFALRDSAATLLCRTADTSKEKSRIKERNACAGILLAECGACCAPRIWNNSCRPSLPPPESARSRIRSLLPIPVHAPTAMSLSSPASARTVF
jgi:hypothetical protein